MKTVFSTGEVAHIWAHQNQPSGRNSGDTISFNGPKLYSYATVIAKLVTNKKNERACVMSTHKYSVTTSSHQSDARSAVNHWTNLWVDKVKATPAEQRDDFAVRIEKAMDAVLSAHKRGKAKAYEAAKHTLGQANAYCVFFGLPTFPPLPESDDLEAAVAERRKRAAQKAKRDEAKRQRVALVNLEAWKAGERVDTYAFRMLPWHYMRVVGDGEVIETTLGARVPASDVREAAEWVLRIVRKGYQYDRFDGNGKGTDRFNFGPFRLDSIDELGTVKVGCHRFPKSEIERMAGVLAIADPVEVS